MTLRSRPGPACAVPVDTRVRIIGKDLGASRLAELWKITDELYGAGDIGRVAFQHPNARLAAEWFYVEVDSKEVPGEKRYVGCTKALVEIV